MMTSDKTNQQVLVNRPTRRQAIVGVAIAFGGLALGSSEAWGEAEDEISHTGESIHQEAVFKASRKRIYEVLIDAKQFDKVIQLSGVMQSMHLGDKPAEISREMGGRVHALRWVHHGTTGRTRVERANRAGLANGQLGSGRLFDCEVRACRTRLRDEDRI